MLCWALHTNPFSRRDVTGCLWRGEKRGGRAHTHTFRQTPPPSHTHTHTHTHSIKKKASHETTLSQQRENSRGLDSSLAVGYVSTNHSCRHPSVLQGLWVHYFSSSYASCLPYLHATNAHRLHNLLAFCACPRQSKNSGNSQGMSLDDGLLCRLYDRHWLHSGKEVVIVKGDPPLNMNTFCLAV